MRIGLDYFLTDHLHLCKGKRVGLVTNMTGVNQQLTPAIDLFHAHPSIELTALYGPEHGIRGSAKEGEKVDFFVDPYTKVPVYSLYGATKKPTKEMLEPVDIIFFDLQDIGARYYTFIYTMAYVMEACAEFGKEFVVLDRPNPISGTRLEGNLVEEECRSFVGLYPIPNRHGMTVGELALFFKHEFGINCNVTVVPMEGWNRDMYYDETDLFWVPPSPNTTGMDMCILYPGTCLVEGTNLSEGRGTTRPFEYIGSPFIEGYQVAKRLNEKKLPGVIARPISFVPTYSKHKDLHCEGIQLHVTDRKTIHSLATGLTVLETIAEMYPKEFEFVQFGEKKTYMFDLLAGTKELKDLVVKGETSRFIESSRVQTEGFLKQREPYLLYK
ncbi:exo-beta-N-acetylmuramidase NamZ domain-containing protein [Fredinandcohnia sp. 179-A 10B2 NHS]|uniref:exo-beta-N-acetylmuramidase NamZ family protein n=1 Tax=Fredinandcohnia sp. 179-A 10B2 NHS TaxID=3235176 RepID=UPI0039A04D7E